jgi:hypothetical protein
VVPDSAGQLDIDLNINPSLFICFIFFTSAIRQIKYSSDKSSGFFSFLLFHQSLSTGYFLYVWLKSVYKEQINEGIDKEK